MYLYMYVVWYYLVLHHCHCRNPLDHLLPPPPPPLPLLPQLEHQLRHHRRYQHLHLRRCPVQLIIGRMYVRLYSHLMRLILYQKWELQNDKYESKHRYYKFELFVFKIDLFTQEIFLLHFCRADDLFQFILYFNSFLKKRK